MTCSLTDPAGCLADVAGSAAGSIADSAFNDIAQDFGNAADSAVRWLWSQISGATAISLSGSAMSRDLAIVTTLAAVVATGLFLIQIIASVLRRDGAGLARAVKGLLVAFLGSVAAIAVTSILLAAVDAVSAGFVQAATGDSTQQMGTLILSTTAISAAGNPAVVLVLSLVVLGAVIVVWAAMMVRKLLIIVAAVFTPLAFAGATADISTSWVRRWIETMVALIVSKLILVIIFVIGLGVLTDGLGESTGATASASATQSITQTIIGALILLMGGFAPWLAIRMIHFGGDHFSQIHRQAQGALSGAQSVAAAPQKAQRLAGSFGALGGAGAAGMRPSGTTRTPSAAPSPHSGVPAASSGSLRDSTGARSAAMSGGAAAGGAAGAALATAGAARSALDKQMGQVTAASSAIDPDASKSTPAPRADGSHHTGPAPQSTPSDRPRSEPPARETPRGAPQPPARGSPPPPTPS